MNKQKSQQGSVHLVVVIILVVALLGALGYIFWQNFSQTKSDEIVDTSSSKTLTISEWGLKGSYSGDTKLLYEVKSGSSDYSRYGVVYNSVLLLGSKDTAFYNSNDEDCNNRIGYVSRQLGDSKYVSPLGEFSTVAENFDEVDGQSDSLWHIGDYYYTYIAPSQFCINGEEALPSDKKIESAMKEFFVGAKEI